jgi:hypothetical protein
VLSAPLYVLYVLLSVTEDGATPYVTCITIIDTIILTNYTNNAYYLAALRPRPSTVERYGGWRHAVEPLQGRLRGRYVYRRV